jgi:LysR family transcriptional regulator, low CO2-responsive transcriptional regulator
MNYTLSQLEIFLKICQNQSITKAAEELHLTQPAVSIQLKNLQNQFDLPLTEVIGRKLYVTDFGKEVALMAENIIFQAHEIAHKSKAFKGELIGKLKISVVSTGKYVIPYFLAGFLKKHPGVALKLDVTNKAQVLDNIAQNEVDFSMVSVLPSDMNIDNLELLQNKLYLITGKDSNYPKKKYDVSIFEELPIIYREKGSGTRYTMERYFESKGIKLQKQMELTTNEAVKQAIIAGLGSSVMPLIGLKNEIQNGELKIIPVKGLPIKSSWQLIWQKNKGFSPVALAFLEYLRNEKDQIIEKDFCWYEEFE